jgi:hypothetical protein
MIPFQKGVKFVTAVQHEKDGKVTFVEQRLSRADKDYTHFVRAAFPNDKKGASEAIAAIRLIKEKGFDEIQIGTFRDVFQNWNKEEKTNQAKKSRSKRGKVKRKDDKRLGARPPG